MLSLACFMPEPKILSSFPCIGEEAVAYLKSILLALFSRLRMVAESGAAVKNGSLVSLVMNTV